MTGDRIRLLAEMFIHGIFDRVRVLTFFVAFGCFAACGARRAGSVYVMFARFDFVGTTSLIAAKRTARYDALTDPI